MFSAIKKLFQHIATAPKNNSTYDPFYSINWWSLGPTKTPNYSPAPPNSVSTFTIGTSPISGISLPGFTIASTMNVTASYQIDATGDMTLMNAPDNKVQLVFDGSPLVGINFDNKNIPKLISLLTEAAIKNESIQDNPTLQEALERLSMILRLSVNDV